MSLVAVIGDGSTTTAVGLAGAWPAAERCVIAEFDPSGGCLSAWLDVPTSPGLAELASSSSGGSWPEIEATFQPSRSGLEVLVAPHRAVEAAAVINAASPVVLPVLSALESPVVVADGGRSSGSLPPLAVQAGVVVVSHRQHPGSAAAATVGIERVADMCELLRRRALPHVVALVGDRPYAADEVARFVGADAVIAVADDPWAASVLAGRAGSAVRFRRSALMRSMQALAAAVSAQLRQSRQELTWEPAEEGLP